MGKQLLGYMYMEIYGAEGYIRIDNRGKTCVTVIGERKGSERLFDFSSVPASSYEAEFRDYVRAIGEGRQPLPSGYDGFRAVKKAHAIYESSQLGRKVIL